MTPPGFRDTLALLRRYRNIGGRRLAASYILLAHFTYFSPPAPPALHLLTLACLVIDVFRAIMPIAPMSRAEWRCRNAPSAALVRRWLTRDTSFMLVEPFMDVLVFHTLAPAYRWRPLTMPTVVKDMILPCCGTTSWRKFRHLPIGCSLASLLRARYACRHIY